MTQKRPVRIKNISISPQAATKPYLIRWTVSALLFLGLSCGIPFIIYKHLGTQSFSLNPLLWSWPVLSAIATLLAIYFISDALRLHFILKSLGQQLDAVNLGKLTFINILFSNITPLATGGGFVQIWYLHRRGVPIGTGTAATTLRTFIAMFLIFLPVPFLVARLPYFQTNSAMAGAGWILAVVAVGYLVCFLVLLFRPRWILQFLDLIGQCLSRSHIVSKERIRKIKRRLLRESVRFSYCLKIFIMGPKQDVFLSVFFTAVFLLSLFSFPSILFWGIGCQVDYPATTGLLAVSTCVMYFAPSPGGAGFAEGIFGLFFASQVTPSDLVGIIVSWRFLTIYLGMLIGVPVTLKEMAWRKKHE